MPGGFWYHAQSEPEYLAVARPIVVVNPTSSDRRLLCHYQGVQCLQSPSSSAFATALEVALSTNSEELVDQARRFRAQYSRRTQVGKLAEWMTQLRS